MRTANELAASGGELSSLASSSASEAAARSAHRPSARTGSAPQRASSPRRQSDDRAAYIGAYGSGPRGRSSRRLDRSAFPGRGPRGSAARRSSDRHRRRRSKARRSSRPEIGRGALARRAVPLVASTRRAATGSSAHQSRRQSSTVWQGIKWTVHPPLEARSPGVPVAFGSGRASCGTRGIRLRLLPSGPDLVRVPTSRRTRPSTPLAAY